MEVWEEPDLKWRCLEPAECPAGVLDGVEDRVVARRTGVVRYGMIGSGAKTAFWEWLAGGGFHHGWTASDPTGIATKLNSTLVDVVLFDHTHPGSRHPVWSTAHVMAVVWYMGPSTIIVPTGWRQQNV